jgi:dTMP kinase
MKTPAGLFITFEGCEGCGKSTQAKLLFRSLEELNVPALLTQEPGGTPLGDSIRDILKTRRNFNINPLSELFLFCACRAQLITDVILPALNSNKVVLCDRYADSTVVYQGYGRGLDLALIDVTNNTATTGLRPDLTILLDTDPALGLQRKHFKHEDRFETEDLAFHNKVRNGYLELASKAPDSWLVVESGKSIDEVRSIIRERIFPLIKSKYQLIADI